MADAPVAITGATGRLGGRVARRLSLLGLPLRLIVRDPKRAPALPGAEVRVATYDAREALIRALEGVRTVFFVSATEAPARREQHFTFIDAAATAGVETVVYTSFFGAAPDATFTFARDHWATEEHLRAQRFASVMLRDNLYLDFLPGLAGADGVIRGPAGQGRVAAVAQDDIAEVAATILANPTPHLGRTYSLTGPQALTLAQVADILSRRLGRELRYHDETIEEAYRSREVYRAERWQVDAWVSTYTAIAAGELATVTSDVEHVTGHPPMDLDTLLHLQPASVES